MWGDDNGALPAKICTEEEAGNRSTWTRWYTSGVFDAKYSNGQTTVNTVRITGEAISAQRTSSSDGNLCSYQGSIGNDGRTITGTYTCPPYGSRPWKAVINCGPKEGAKPPNQVGTPLVAKTSPAASPAAIHAANPRVPEEARRTQVDRDKWPEYPEPIHPTQWPVFFSDQVKKSAAICIEVDPKGSPDLASPFNVEYSLTLDPAAQFRIIVDEEERVPPSRPNTSSFGTFGLQRGKHAVEVVVRQPVELARLAMVIQTNYGGHVADWIRLCGAQAAPSILPSPPVPIYKPEPEYSEEARKAKFQGTVMLSVVVGVDGTAKDIRVVRSLGMGLDEKAVEAVSKWKFKPATINGRPVTFKANVEVNFKLL
ncbi:MAG: energy transducer TonB [Bryobacteraceae bacterium]